MTPGTIYRHKQTSYTYLETIRVRTEKGWSNYALYNTRSSTKMAREVSQFNELFTPAKRVGLTAAFKRRNFEMPYEKILAIIADHISKRYYVDVKSLIRHCNERRYAVPRNVFCYLACIWRVASLKEIGLFLDGRDHSTVISSRNSVAGMLSLPEYKWLTALQKASVAEILEGAWVKN